jgi:transposase InsO family protein
VPWKVNHRMTERMQFVTRLAKGERMTDLCREFGISRKTGYKFWERFERRGVAALDDESRAPKRVARKTSPAMEQLLLEARKAHGTWGGRKLKAMIEREHPELRLPSASAVAAILKRNGLVKDRRRRRHPGPWRGELTAADGPNEVWAVDYKGQFRLGNREYCYPLTATDLASRFILAIEALDGTDDEQARAVFQDVFKAYGLPAVIRSDNGVPFASQGLAGLTRLSAWWLRLGVRHERTQPAHPEQNGQHERMHRTLKAETARPARANLMQQQERFDEFREEFNGIRPHDALDLKRPADLYRVSDRQLPDPLPDLNYPLHDDVLVVKSTGHIRLPRGRQVFLAHALAGQPVGLREDLEGRWLVTFVNLDLGSYHPGAATFEPLTSPQTPPVPPRN